MNVVELIKNVFLVWIKEKQMAGDRISESIICAKVKQLLDDLLANVPSGSDSTLHDFLTLIYYFIYFHIYLYIYYLIYVSSMFYLLLSGVWVSWEWNVYLYVF